MEFNVLTNTAQIIKKGHTSFFLSANVFENVKEHIQSTSPIHITRISFYNGSQMLQEKY